MLTSFESTLQLFVTVRASFTGRSSIFLVEKVGIRGKRAYSDGIDTKLFVHHSVHELFTRSVS